MAREPHFVVKYSSYLGTAIKLVLYILKHLFVFNERFHRKSRICTKMSVSKSFSSNLTK